MIKKLKDHIDKELRLSDDAERLGEHAIAFKHLERAHVLGQSNTVEHTRVHWRMLKFGLRTRDANEVIGQMIRIGGTATKTPLGIYPVGNTGGANVSPFRPMPVDEDLTAILNDCK